MTAREESSISGRALVVSGLVVAVLTMSASVVWGPGLREEVRQADQPRTLREPIASGRHDGQVWEAVGRFDGQANCVELRFRGAVLDRACDTGEPLRQTALPDDGPTIAYGVAGEAQTSVTLTLDDGSSVVTPAVAGELGFPVSFWAIQLPPRGGVAASDADLP